MSSAQIQEHASSAAQEELGRVHSPQASSTVTPALQMQKQQHDAQHRQANDEYVMVDSWGSPSPKKKRRRTESVEAECDLEENEVAAGAEQQKSTAEEKKEEKGEDAEENGRMNEEKETAQDQADAREVVANGSAKEGQVVDDGQVSGDEKQPESEGVDAVEKQQEVGDEPNVEDAARSGQAQSTSSTPVRVPSPAVHISGVDMVFPEDEVPIELCPFSSDGSVDPPHLESPPRRSNSTEEAPHEAPAATVTTPAAAPVVDTAPSTPASVTAEESTVPTAVNSTTGRRKRRKKLIYSVPRSKATTGAKQEQKSAPVSPLLEEKLSIAVNGHEAEIGVAGDSDGSAPPSPVYPDADASHLYPSTPEGEPWRWEDVDPYFDPLAQNDLDNLVRWRKENADFIAANPYEWRGKSGMESKRAVLEAMLADASDASTAHVEFPVRRGRNYRGVWEETDFLEQQKRDISTGESNLKSQVVNMKKKPSVEFALGLGVGDVVDVLDRNGCWNYGEIVEIYSEDKMGLAKFVLLRFSLWSEDTVEWIAASEGRILPRGVADGTRPCSVGPTRAHRARVSYDQSLARELERSFPQRQAKQSTAVSNMLVRRQHNVVIPSSIDQQKTPQKRKRKRPAKSTTVTPPQT
ncbi:hypothetical protein PF010_g8613 [Phytophthora fragariae]|uniref:Uncharacterized protein n=1 Tax=Phytophthora fragariae TaxID=53985 RepID=A0A6G0LDY6_9STRA|nr:hypothetical protein PF010_g8613 [Phytophthora fragariae]